MWAGGGDYFRKFHQRGEEVKNKAKNKRGRRAKGIIRDNAASHSLDDKMDLHKFAPGKYVAKL